MDDNTALDITEIRW